MQQIQKDRKISPKTPKDVISAEDTGHKKKLTSHSFCEMKDK